MSGKKDEMIGLLYELFTMLIYIGLFFAIAALVLIW